MSVEIRPATDDERTRCVNWWHRSVAGRMPEGRDGLRWVNCGRAEVQADILSPIARTAIESIAVVCHVDVAELGGEPLGFVAHGYGRLHYVFVTGEARRKGLGTMLFRHAIKGDYTPTFMTRAGRALEEHALRLIAAEQGHHERREILE